MPSPQRVAHAFRAQADTANIRTETFNGRDYTVVPVIGLVEGVIQSMNSTQAELVTAQEFSRNHVGWNGRPLVMGHPVVNGSPVSANDPHILEQYQMGMIFNTRVEDKKLKFEAWVDNERAPELNDNSKDAFEALQEGKVIEVSTGLYTTVIDQSGRYNGEEYFGVWEGITPDHLAILPSGVVGACSVEDGCGANRASQSASARRSSVMQVESPKATDVGRPRASGASRRNGTTTASARGSLAPSSSSLFTAAEMRSNAWRNSVLKPHCDCGGTCGHCGDTDMPGEDHEQSKAPARSSNTSVGERQQASHSGGAGSGNGADPGFLARLLSSITGKPISVDDVRRHQAEPPQFEPSVILQGLIANQFSRRPVDTDATVKANGAPAGMLSKDVQAILADALADAYSDEPYSYVYVVGFTADKVVWMCYDANFDVDTWQCSYEISADGSTVTLADDDEEVNLITQIVVVQGETETEDGVVANQSVSTEQEQGQNSSAREGSQNQETKMSGQNAGGQAQNTNANANTNTNANTGQAPETANNAAGEPVPNTNTTATRKDSTVTGEGEKQVAEGLNAGGKTSPAHTLDQLLDNASPELKASLRAMQENYRRQKEGVIAGLRASGRCRFSDEQLAAKDLDELNALSELANVPNYGGLAPGAPVVANQAPAYGQRTNNGMGVPLPEPAFPIGGAGNAGKAAA